MICKACCNANHKDCTDFLHEHLYKSCDCQHRVKPVPFKTEEAQLGESVEG